MIPFRFCGVFAVYVLGKNFPDTLGILYIYTKDNILYESCEKCYYMYSEINI